MSSTPLVIAAAILVTPLIMRGLARAFPPRVSIPQDYESLRSRHGATELWSRVVAMVGIVAGFCFILQVRRNTPWLVGAMMGWMTIPPLVFVALRTLPKGFSCWQEFWRFYELRNRISLRLLSPTYALLAIIGVISTVVLIVVE